MVRDQEEGKMGDLISREAAISAMYLLQIEDEETYGCSIPEGFDGERAAEALRRLPSAEPERTAKVLEHKYYIGTALNIVGAPKFGYEYLCGNCKKKVIGGDEYCSHCGARLEWLRDLSSAEPERTAKVYWNGLCNCCSNCSRPIETTSMTRCAYCGARLEGSE